MAENRRIEYMVGDGQFEYESIIDGTVSSVEVVVNSGRPMAVTGQDEIYPQTSINAGYPLETSAQSAIEDSTEV